MQNGRSFGRPPDHFETAKRNGRPKLIIVSVASAVHGAHPHVIYLTRPHL
ncbi:MAG: hypothetical protein ACKER6_00825 [Candidatus Hodgkinia cicadicola]